jgi:xanthine/uracil permease
VPLLLQILMLGEGFSRRNRFIVSCALAFGMGVSMVPQWSKNALWPDPGLGANQSLQSVRTAVLLILDTGFCVGAIVAFVLNMIVPHEQSQPEVGQFVAVVLQLMLHNPTI